MITIHGFGFAGGSDYKCRFAQVVTPASYHNASSTIQCVSIAVHTSMQVQVQVSLNAQQYHGGSNIALNFSMYAVPHVSSLSPNMGPTSVPTMLRVFGFGLSEGKLYNCKFAAADGTNAAIIQPASFDAASHTILCLAVPVASTMAVEVAINSQDYTTDHVSFVYYNMPNIRGSGFANLYDVQCKFGKGSGVVSFDDSVSKWYGSSLAHASHISASEVICIAPSGVEAGVTRSVLHDFEQDGMGTPMGSKVLGDATIDAGHLLLTNNRINQVGSFVLDVLDSEHVVRQFDASFLVRMWDGMCGQDGVGGQCGGSRGHVCRTRTPPDFSGTRTGVDREAGSESISCKDGRTRSCSTTECVGTVRSERGIDGDREP